MIRSGSVNASVSRSSRRSRTSRAPGWPYGADGWRAGRPARPCRAATVCSGRVARGLCCRFLGDAAAGGHADFLDYLVQRLTAAGGQIEQDEVRVLAEVAEEAPLIANCSGLGSRELVPDPSVRPVRGQHVIVDNPGLEDFFIEAPFGPAWTASGPTPTMWCSAAPRSKATRTWNQTRPSPRRSCVAAPRSRLLRASVRDHQVGLRPVGRRCGWRSNGSGQVGACTTTGTAALG